MSDIDLFTFVIGFINMRVSSRRRRKGVARGDEGV